MAKYIIAIWGTSNQGKSETVSLIYRELRINFPNSTEEIFIKKKDLMLILTNGKKKIGIESQGDPGSRLNESIKFFITEGCEIIICSTRTSGSTVNNLEKAAKANGYTIIWATNYRSDTGRAELNLLSAQQIVTLIKRVI